MPISSIATHPQKQKIIAAIVARQPYRDIMTWAEPKVSMGALVRFKRSALDDLKGGAYRSTAGALRIAPERRAAQGGAEPIYDTCEVMTGAESSAGAALAAQSSPFRGQLDHLRQVTMRTLERAERAVRVDSEGNTIGQDLACVAPLLAQGHRNVELLGKATGELSDGQQTTVNNLAIMMNLGRD